MSRYAQQTTLVFNIWMCGMVDQGISFKESLLQDIVS